MNNLLITICRNVRNRKIRKSGTVDGGCKEVSLAILYEAILNGIDLCICSGTYNGEDHYWLRHNNTIYDATATQFGMPEEVFVISEVEAEGYLGDPFIFANATLVSELIST